MAISIVQCCEDNERGGNKDLGRITELLPQMRMTSESDCSQFKFISPNQQILAGVFRARRNSDERREVVHTAYIPHLHLGHHRNSGINILHIHYIHQGWHPNNDEPTTTTTTAAAATTDLTGGQSQGLFHSTRCTVRHDAARK